MNKLYRALVQGRPHHARQPADAVPRLQPQEERQVNLVYYAALGTEWRMQVCIPSESGGMLARAAGFEPATN